MSTRQKENNLIILENEHVYLSFSSLNGALVDFIYKHTGWRINNTNSQAQSFIALLPLEGRRNNNITGSEQTLQSYEVSNGGQQVEFVWSGVKSGFGGFHDITIRASVELKDAETEFRMIIENNSDYTVEAVTYPIIASLSAPSPDTSLERMNYGYSGMEKAPVYPRFANEKGYFGVDYPTQMAATPNVPFVLIGSEGQGIYTGCHEDSNRGMVQFFLQMKPGHSESIDTFCSGYLNMGQKSADIEFSTVHFPYAGKGERAELSGIVLSPYAGSWHKGADIYRKWCSRWNTPAPMPQWASRVHSWQQIHINSPEDELRYRYTELVKIGEDCVKHGVDAIQLVGWNVGGQDKGNPSHDTDPRLGTWEELKSAIEQIQERGVKVVLFNKYTWSDRSTEWFRNELIKYSAKDPYGDYYMHPGWQYQTPVQLSDINTRRLVPMCALSAEWQDIACREFQKNIDLGAAGILFDECFFHGPAKYCFDRKHGHHCPGFLYEGNDELSGKFQKLAVESGREFLIGGEACYDLQKRYYPVSYIRIRTYDHIPVQRYIDPFYNIMVAVMGFDDRNLINICLMYRYIISYEPYNFKGRLEDYPLTLEYGKKVDRLRRKYSEYLWEAEFKDTLGAEVTINGKSYSRYAVYYSYKTAKHTVVVANYDVSNSIDVCVKLDRPCSGFIEASPEKQEGTGTDGRITIAPRSAVVLIEK